MSLHRAVCIATFALLFCSLFALNGRAQIVADRPGFLDRAVTVGRRTVQVESGYAYRDVVRSTHQFGPVLIRGGLTQRLELRAGLGQYVVADNRRGYRGGALGAKMTLLNTRSAALGAMTTTTLPLSSVSDAPNRARQQLLLAFDGALSERITISVNSGAAFFYSAGANNDRSSEGLFFGALGGSITQRVSSYVGYAGFYGQRKNRSWIESGITLLATPSTQVDLNAGMRVDGNVESAAFVGAGLAHRL